MTNDFSAAAFNDPAGGKTFAETFIKTNKVDVLFQVAGKTGNGVLEAACAAKIYGIGVDVDQWVSLGAPANACIITSAEKKLVELGRRPGDQGDRRRHASRAGDVLYNAANDGIGVVRLPRPGQPVRPRSHAASSTTALAAMKAGTLKTCPDTGCGVAK